MPSIPKPRPLRRRQAIVSQTNSPQSIPEIATSGPASHTSTKWRYNCSSKRIHRTENFIFYVIGGRYLTKKSFAPERLESQRIRELRFYRTLAIE
jgi:hypothetical protein